MALSLYNKYRPQTFGDVVGQEHIEKTLANAVEKNKVSHAYLFCGPRGTGKTTTARILAKALLCTKAPTATPDGTCGQCKDISEGIHPDVYELDAASRTGVDNVREEIIGRVSFAPTQGNYKIYIIDEVHMLSTPAFNALLKTLEEPPSHVVFVLCTTDVHKVPDTVQARCQRFDFKRLTPEEITGRIKYISEREGFDFEQAALELIAQRSQGGMRDAIRSLEQISIFSAGKISYEASESLLGMVDAEQLFELCDSIAAHDAAACFGWVAAYVQSGSDLAILVNDLAVHVRNLYAAKVSRGPDTQLASSLEIEEDTLLRLRKQATSFGTQDRLAWMLTVLGALSAELKNAANARLALEVALTRMLYPESETSLAALSARVAALEERLVSGEAYCSPQGEHMPEKEKRLKGEEREKELSGQTTTESTDKRSSEKAGTTGFGSAQDEDNKPEEKTVPLSGEPTNEQDSEQALYRQWNEVVDTIKKKKKQGLAANLGGVSLALSKDGNRLTLELPPGATTTQQYLGTDANKSLLHQTVQQVFGRPLEIKTTVAAPTSARSDGVERAAFTPTMQADEQDQRTQEDAGKLGLDSTVPRESSSSSSGAADITASGTGATADKGKTTSGTPATEIRADTGMIDDAEPSRDELEDILNNSLNSIVGNKGTNE